MKKINTFVMIFIFSEFSVQYTFRHWFENNLFSVYFDTKWMRKLFWILLLLLFVLWNYVIESEKWDDGKVTGEDTLMWMCQLVCWIVHEMWVWREIKLARNCLKSFRKFCSNFTLGWVPRPFLEVILKMNLKTMKNS